jgi:hypothetical protein
MCCTCLQSLSVFVYCPCWFALHVCFRCSQAVQPSRLFLPAHCPAALTCKRGRSCLRPPPCPLERPAACLECRWHWQALEWRQPPARRAPTAAAPRCRAARPRCCCASRSRSGRAVPAAASTASLPCPQQLGERVAPPHLCHLPVFSVGSRWDLRRHLCCSHHPAAHDAWQIVFARPGPAGLVSLPHARGIHLCPL